MPTVMTIVNKMQGADQAIFYSEAFRAQLEDALQWLINYPLTKSQTVDSILAYEYEGDFYGLCNYYNIPYQFHWLVMRMSGLAAPDEASRELNTILIPEPNVIQQMVSNFNTLPSAFIPAPGT